MEMCIMKKIPKYPIPKFFYKKEDAIRIDKEPWSNKTVYIYECIQPECKKEIRIRIFSRQYTGRCKSHIKGTTYKAKYILKREDAIRIERIPKINGIGTYKILIYKCNIENCSREVKVNSSNLTKHSGKCDIHGVITRGHFQDPLKPYLHIYKFLIGNHSKHKVDITWNQFLKFIEIKNCTYCNSIIQWDKPKTKAYFLDRLDNSKHYFVENCVVCCSYCNWFRGDRFTPEEMSYIMPILLEFRKNKLNEKT